MPNAHILSDMTWLEAKEAFAQAELAIIPIGSFEQHAPYMTFEVDSARAYGFAKLLGERLYPRVIVAPPITFGISHHHMKFPGTITLEHDTFFAVIRDVVRGLMAHGIKQFFLANGHGGNNPSLEVMIVRLRHELGIKIAYAFISATGSEVTRNRSKTVALDGHCGEGETSQAMYLAPHVVRPERIVRGTVKGHPYKHLGRSTGIVYPSNWEELTENGALGDATNASAELGKQIIDAALIKTSEFLSDFIDKNAKE
jgi:creatinine amidohydrolase